MRSELVKIYQGTKFLCSEIKKPESVKHRFTDSLFSKYVLPKQGKVTVEPIDTVTALVKYAPIGKTAILNMANATSKGGGVERGAMAQEECLFRCSNLYTIADVFYPMRLDEFVYTKDVTFIKDVNYRSMSPVKVDVITIAALNLNPKHKQEFHLSEYGYPNNSLGIKTVTLEKICYMLDSAYKNRCTNIILGAFGCGAFKNDPTVMANLFKLVLSKYSHLFDNIVFAIINDRNSVGDNYQIFKTVLE